jgi:hypothetical protein
LLIRHLKGPTVKSATMLSFLDVMSLFFALSTATYLSYQCLLFGDT